MANSSIIGIAKNKIIKEFIKDDEIVKAIDSHDITSPQKLVNTHIFNYHQNPNTIDTAGTFITIQVHIPEYYSRYESDDVFVKPIIEIWIISHERHMVVDNIPKVTDNRNDYLSKLIDKKLNKKSGFGIGTLRLTTNIEGSFQKDFLYRKMVFECVDLNNSLCRDE